MCMHTSVSVSAHAWKNGSQYPECSVGRPSFAGISENATAVHATRRVVPDLGGGELDVPQRNEAQRDQAAAGVAAPLLDHPVVVRAHARQREVLVLRLGERLPAEARERREAQRRLDVVDVHVLEPGLRVVATGAHLVVGDRRQRHLVAREPDRGDVALVRRDQLLVEPGVGLGLRVVPLDLVGRAALVLHLADAPALDAGRARVVGVLLRQPLLEQVGRFHHVVVDADEPGDVTGHGFLVPGRRSQLG